MHSSKHRLVSLSSILTLLGGVLHAQTAVLPTAAPSVQALGIGHSLATDAEGLVGVGADYLVRFCADGMQFVPVMGENAAPCAPLRITLTSIRRGDAALPCALEVAPSARGDFALFERSPSIVERYELHDRGVEQSFVFTELPGRGDLVVRCELGGLGAFAEATADGGLAFCHDGERIVRMGTVLGIDARGRRAAGQLRMVDGGVELSLPASFVDTAELPLVLDPFIGSLLVPGPGTTFDVSPDVAYDPVRQHWVFVWERDISIVQSDILRRTWSMAAGLGPLTVMASTATQVNQAPKIAYHTGIARFLVVFEQTPTSLGQATVIGMVVEQNGNQGGQFVMGAPGAGANLDPDVSGDPTGSGRGIVTYKLVGASGVQGLRYRPYTLGATGDPVVGGQAAISTTPSAVRARVSKSSGPRIAVVWEERPGTYSGVFIRSILRTGVREGSSSGIVNVVGGPDLHRPEVDGVLDGSRFLMALEYQRGFGDRDVSCAEFVWNGAGFGAPTASANVSGLVGTDESAPTVAFLGHKFAVAWEHQIGFLSGSVRCRTFAPSGCVSCSSEQPMPTAGNFVQPALASDVASGGTGTAAMLACAQSNATLPATADVVGFVWDTHTPTVPLSLGAGCGSPTTLEPLGVAGIGNPSFGVRVRSNDPLAGVGAFSFGFGFTTPLLPCGSCRLVNPVVMLPTMLSAGIASQPLSLPCDMGLIGLELQAQCLVVGSTQNACPLLGTLSMSETLGFTITE